MYEPSRPVVEAASWQLASAIVRRHPQLEVMRHHPGGGMYDVLEVVQGGEQLIGMNRAGSIHVHERAGAAGGRFDWAEWICASDRWRFLTDLEQLAGLRPPVRQPLSPPVLVFATIAALANLGAQTEPFTIGTGYLDGLGGEDAEWWAEMSSRAPELTRPRPSDHFGRAGYRFWRVERSDFAVTFETSTATLWGPHDEDTRGGGSRPATHAAVEEPLQLMDLMRPPADGTLDSLYKHRDDPTACDDNYSIIDHHHDPARVWFDPVLQSLGTVLQKGQRRP